ncbi:unknown protein [Leptolyngbya sp. NIES-3755]|nr:unknown protein [Leptolyngbya sp. NIES-3755]
MADQKRSSNGCLPFLLGVGVMAITGGSIYLFTQRQATAPTTSPIANAPTTVAPASPQSPTQSPTSPPPTDTLPPAPTVNLQVNHPNGSTARLTQLTFGEDNIAASIAVTNGYKEAIKLNGSEDFVITDNFGNQYNLATPPENAEINIAPGTTLKGQFVFKGRLAPNTTSITVTTNSKFGTDATFSTTPKIVFNVPLPGGAK